MATLDLYYGGEQGAAYQWVSSAGGVACTTLDSRTWPLQATREEGFCGVLPWTFYAAIAGQDADSVNFVMSIF